MSKKSIYSLVSAFVLMGSFSFVSTVKADDNFASSEMKILEEKLHSLEAQVASLSANQKAVSSPVKEVFSDLKISGGSTFVIQSTIDANATDKKGEDVTDATFSIDIELEKSIGEKGTVFTHLEAGNGAGLDGEEVNVFGGVNADATGGDSSVELIEMWYEHSVSENFRVTFGKIDATCYLDDNAFANDECGQFLGASFKNSTAIEFPDDNGLGVRLALSPSEKVEVNLGVVESDGDWEDVSDDLFVFGQINLMPKFFDKEGNYRFYGWMNNKAHTDFNDSSKGNENNAGFGISFDQMLSEHIGAFVRLGTQKKEVSTLESAWSLGLQVNGNIWDRENDFLGIAFGQNMASDDYGKTGEPDATESHIEVYYNYYVNDSLTISPDFQMIFNPNGVDSSSVGRDDTVCIVGIRAQLGF